MQYSIRKNIVILFLCSVTLLITKNTFAQKHDKFILVIDPGHGGKDEGTSAFHVKEKDIVLKIALQLDKAISKRDTSIQIILTRASDKFIPLYKRAEIANQANADLFVSLHANSCNYPNIHGTETYVLGLHQTEENLDVAKKENAVILMESDYKKRYAGFDPNSSESYIMFEMVQDQYLAQSIQVASLIQRKLNTEADRGNRGVKQSGFLVLRQTIMPSILCETGFLSNQKECSFLNSTQGQQKIVKALCDALIHYKNSVSNPVKSHFTPPNQVKKDDKIKQTTPAIYYSLQLAASKTPIKLNSSFFHGLTEIEQKQINEWYKYYYLKETSLSIILRKRKEILSKFPGAFVTAFDHGNQISLKKAKRLLQNSQ